MHDLLIRGAQVYDGLGNAPKYADVAVHNGRINAIGKVASAARETVDAGGLSLMPGIVDLHTHYDAQVTWDRTMSPSSALGVTTAVIGNCGFGVAPCPASMRETMMKNLSVVEGMLAGQGATPKPQLPMTAVVTPSADDGDIVRSQVTWAS